MTSATPATTTPTPTAAAAPSAVTAMRPVHRIRTVVCTAPSASLPAGREDRKKKGICTVLDHRVTHRHPKNGDSMRGHPDR
eukprot:scaffold1894_cov120-Isochrysis_galbana.AAC.2